MVITFTFDKDQVLNIGGLERTRQICSVDEVLLREHFRFPAGDVVELNEDAWRARGVAEVAFGAVVVDHSDVEQADRLFLWRHTRRAVGHIASHKRHFRSVVVDRLLQLLHQIRPSPALQGHVTVTEVDKVLRTVRFGDQSYVSIGLVFFPLQESKNVLIDDEQVHLSLH